MYNTKYLKYKLKYKVLKKQLGGNPSENKSIKFDHCKTIFFNNILHVYVSFKTSYINDPEHNPFLPTPTPTIAQGAMSAMSVMSVMSGMIGLNSATKNQVNKNKSNQPQSPQSPHPPQSPHSQQSPPPPHPPPPPPSIVQTNNTFEYYYFTMNGFISSVLFNNYISLKLDKFYIIDDLIKPNSKQFYINYEGITTTIDIISHGKCLIQPIFPNITTPKTQMV